MIGTIIATVPGLVSSTHLLDRERNLRGAADGGIAKIAAWRVHAPGRNPYRVVAVSGSLLRRQLQPHAPDPFRAEAGAGPFRRLVHGRPPGGPQHADGGVEAQRDGDLVRPAHPI